MGGVRAAEAVMRMVRGGWLLLIAGLLYGWAAGSELLPLGGQLSLQTGETRSTLDRETGWVTTSAVLRADNTGDRPLLAPLHVVVRPADGGAGFSVDGALGGPDDARYGAYYFDLSDTVGDGLQPGQGIELPFSYSRPAGSGGYALEAYGLFNQDPVARILAPQAIVAGEAVVFDGTGSFDPEGEPLAFAWEFGDDAGPSEPVAEFSFALPGTYTIRLRVVDRQGAVDEVFRTVVVVPPGSFSLAQVRTLDASGQPLGGVAVEDLGESPGPAGLSSAEGGIFVGAGEPGTRVWKFSLPGRLPVWREIAFVDRAVVLAPSPWLAPAGRRQAPVSPLEAAAIGGASERARLEFPAGAFSQPGQLGLTALSGNSLPLPLPRGWTPLAAFHYSFPGELVEPGAATWLPPVAPRAGDLLAVARFDPDELEWQVLQVLDGPGLAQTDLTRDGWFVLALADAQPDGPPAPLAGAALPSAPVGDEPVVLSAKGIVDPAQRVASLDPERVTARAEVTFAGAAGLASGRFFRAEISERYSLADGRVLRTPDYDTTFFAYRGLLERDPDTLVAEFPLRPALLFDSAELAEARIVATVLDPETFAGTVLDPLGGQLSAGAVTLRIPAGAFADRTVGELREISSEGFLALLGGLVPVAAFQLNAPAALGELEVAIAGVAPDADYILARLITPAGRPALEPVLRMRSDASGTARSTEPASGTRLPGIGAGGRYVLVAVDARPGLLAGIARALDGAPAAGLVAAVVGQPWQALSRAGGAFVSVAPVGTWTAEAVDPADANRGTAEFSIATSADIAEVDIQVVATGPRVIATMPGDGAVNVRAVTPVVVTFSEPLDPLSFGPESLELVDPLGALVSGSLGLNSGATEATFLPVNPLRAAADYRILLAPTIRDRSGLPVEGELEFGFRTASPAARGIGAELVIYEPGALNVPEEVLSQLVGYAAGAGSSHVVATGGPGTADPEVPVILVNNASGATATVLSRPDGSFASFIDADEEDFVEAVFINANDTRVTIPATKQLFDDGRIGLYRYGGILEAESDGGPVEVFVEPEAIEERVTFELKSLDLGTVLAAFEGSEATEGQALGAVRLAHDANKELSIPVDISFPLDRSILQLPPGIERAEDATFVLARAVETVDGEIVYEILDTMQVDGDRLVTRSPPYPGILMQTITTALQTRSTSFKKPGDSSLILRAMGLPSIRQTVIHQLLLPFMMIVGGTTSDIVGSVKSVRVDASGNPLGEPQPVLGASVSFSPPPFRPAGKFRPGLFVVASREPNGFFAFRADITLEGLGYSLRATHPRFPNQVALKSGQIGGLSERFLEFDIRREDLIFIIPPISAEDLGADVSAPRVRASHAPFLPLAGLDGGAAGAQLLLIAEDDREVADLRAVLLEGRRANGLLLDPSDVTVEFVEVLLESPQRFEHAYRVASAHPGRVLVEISATDPSGNLTTIVHAIDFGREPLVAPSPDGDSELGPRVTSAWPPEGSVNHAPFPEIWLNFSRPLPPEAFAPANSDWITFSSQHSVVSVVPSADRREARIRISGAGTGEVAMQIGSPLTDEQGRRAFDQDPGEQGEQAFNLRFSLAARSVADLGMERGGGVVGAGARLFALERGQTVRPALLSYDVSDPSAPIRIGSLGLPANPADITYIPAYPLQARLDQPPVKRDLIVAIGGTNGGGAPGTATATFKWMWVIDVTDAANPFRLASGNISQDPISLVAKVLADPPLISYLTLSADVTSLHVVDLAAFVIGQNATPEQRAAFPEVHTPGLDLNGDGDFDDPGEQVSLPSRSPATYYGEFFSFAPLNPRERLADFATGPNGGLFAITFNLDTRATRFLNILATIGELDDEKGSLLLPDSDGKRVATIGAVPMVLDGQSRLLDLALVSLRAGEASGPSLAVIDISQPLVPSLLGYVRLPDDAGIPQSVIRRADGTLALALTSDLLILDPSRLLEVDPAGNSLAILQRISGLGSGARSYVASADGLNALALGNRASVTFTGPQFSVITFNRPPEEATAIAALGESDKLNLLGGANPSAILRRAALSFTDGEPDPSGGAAQPVPADPSPADHYYVLVRAPGGAGETLPLMLASVDPTGRLPAPANGATLSPVLVDDATRESLFGPPPTPEEDEGEPAPDTSVYPTSITAQRLSNDPGNPCYNLYLAGPFTLHGSLTPEQAKALTEQLPRAFLKANRRVVVGIPPNGGAGFLDPFRARVSEGQLVAGTSAILPTDYRRNPLVFVPGVMASRLVDPGALLFGSGTLTSLWINPLNALDLLTGDLEKLVLDADGNGSEVGAVDAIRYVALDNSLISGDVQGRFIRYFVDELGYREYLPEDNNEPDIFYLERDGGSPDWGRLADQPDLFVFGYDWRQSVERNAELLEKHIELIFESLPDADSVDIVAHSMGGLVSRRLIMNKPSMVSRLITIASPFLGAPKAVFTMATGDIDDFKLNFIVPLGSSKRIARYMPAMHQLLPNRGYFELGGRPVLGHGISSAALEYDDYKQLLDERLFELSDEESPLPISRNNEPFALATGESGGSQYDWSADTSGVSYYHIVALQQAPLTIDRIILDRRLEPDPDFTDVGLFLPAVSFFLSEQVGRSFPILPDPEWLDPFERTAFRLRDQLTPLRGAGDGTVPLLSATRGYSSSDLRFNAPGTVMIPVVGKDATPPENEASSHVGVLQNKDLQQLVGRILLDDAVYSDQPQLSLSVPSSVREGEAFTFSLSVTRAPALAGDVEPVIVWDMGDGRVVSGSPGESLTHQYVRDGQYTVTCCIWYPGLTGAVESRTITVTDTAPTVVIAAVPENPQPGEPVVLFADVDDAGLEDRYRFEWTIDGELQSQLPDTAFFLERAFAEAGTYGIEVLVDAGGGISASAELQLVVADAAAGAPVAVPASGTSGPRFFPQESTVGGPVLDTAIVAVSGHEVAALGKTQVRHGGFNPANFAAGLVGSFLGMAIEPTGQKSESLKITRIRNDGSVPDLTTIEVTAASEQVVFHVTFSAASGSTRCLRWEMPAAPGGKLKLTLAWDELATITDTELIGLIEADSAPSFAAAVSCYQGTDPVVRNLLDERTGLIQLASVDRDPTAGGGEEPATQLAAAQRVGFVDSVSADPDCAFKDGDVVVLARQTGLHQATIPGNTRGLIAKDNRRSAQAPGAVQKRSVARDVISAEDAEEIRLAVKRAFNQGAATELFRSFVLEQKDLLILEQGTGANLWKEGQLGKLQGAYKKGKSDNDYEILLPVFKASPLDPDKAADRLDMELYAHTPRYMRGDWYFRPPHGIDANGNDMGPVPNSEDTIFYTRYLAAVSAWRYYLPDGITTTLAGASLPEVDGDHYLQFAKGAKFFQLPVKDPAPGQPATQPEKTSVFDNPATPADVISFALSMRLVEDTELRKILKDVSFFPFRREHFEFAVMSLEKPPPFGDDPIGDAGMGRSLLLLKWVLEGALLPEFSGFNPGINAAADLSLRTAVFNRLQARADAIAIEGFEWGIYQEFASLAEGVPLRVRTVSSETRCADAFTDYLKAHDVKTLKKAGKSAIRGALARLAADDSTRSGLFSVNPASFDADADLKSFEHLIARLAAANITTFPGFEANDFVQFLRAKLADKSLALELQAQEDGVDSFLESAFTLLNEQVQQESVLAYLTSLESLERAGQLNQWQSRVNNANAIDYGFSVPGGASRPGRIQMHGVQPGHEHIYALALAIRRVGDASAGPYTVTLESGPETLTLADISFAGDDSVVVVGGNDTNGDPILSIRQDAGQTATLTHTLSVDAGDNSSISYNTSVGLESYGISTNFFSVPALQGLGDRLILYRGLGMTDDQINAFKGGELAAKRLLSASRRSGVDDTVTLDDMANELDAIVAPLQSYFGFAKADIADMDVREKAALRHIKDVPVDTAGISAAHEPGNAIDFALVNSLTGGRKPYLLVLEVARNHSGYHYLPTLSPNPLDAKTPRKINPDEGDEVVFLFELPFLRAHVFEINKDPTDGSATGFTFVGQF